MLKLIRNQDVIHRQKEKLAQIHSSRPIFRRLSTKANRKLIKILFPDP
jgi:hypothetical protein